MKITNKHRKLKQYANNFIASVFSGTIIAIFFLLIGNLDFSLPVALIGLFIFLIITYLLLFMFYYYGIWIMNDQKEKLTFPMNYIAGIFGSIISAALILTNGSWISVGVIVVLSVIAFSISAKVVLK